MFTKARVFLLSGIAVLAILILASAGIGFAGSPGDYRVPLIEQATITQLDRFTSPVNCAGHDGVGRYMDISAAAGDDDLGTPVYASGSGTVTVGKASDYGNYVLLNSDGVTFNYAHLAKVHVTEGQPVAKGGLIGFMGKTGMASVPVEERFAHLHWEARPESFNIFAIPGVNEDTSSPCVGNDGTTSDTPLPSNPYTSCSEYAAQGFQHVTLFDHADCRGNTLSLYGSPSYALRYVLTLTSQDFNDRTRSIYIPSGWSVLVGGNVDDYPYPLRRCLTSTQANLDDLYYSDTDPGGNSVRTGFDRYNESHHNAWDMISYVVVSLTTSCGSYSTSVGSYTVGRGGGGGSGGSGGGGNDTVAIYDNAGCSGTQYGWHDPTSGWFDLNAQNGPDYMNDKASCIKVGAGWSALVSQDFGGGGGQKCFAATNTNLANATYYSGVNVNDSISSVKVFNNADCDGTAPEGVADGDTVTIHVNSGYSGTRYGWHDPVTQNTVDYVTNNVTSIGVVPGWSIAVYENQNQQGGIACVSVSDGYLGDNFFNNDASVNDNIESVRVFQDNLCGGLGGPPNATMTYEILDPVTGEVEVDFAWSNAAPKWQRLNWGDGSYMERFGSSGTETLTHNYVAGDYTITFEVVGNDRQTYRVVEALSIVPVCSISVSSEPPPNPGDPSGPVTASFFMQNASEWDWYQIFVGEEGWFACDGNGQCPAEGPSATWLAPGTYVLEVRKSATSEVIATTTVEIASN